MRVKHIKFKVMKDGPNLHCTTTGKVTGQLSQKILELNWSLGMGPCGRWVESLEVDITLAVVTIKQTSYEGDYESLQRSAIARMKPEERKGLFVVMCPEVDSMRKTKEIKTFIYKLEDVRGRIEAIEQGPY